MNNCEKADLFRTSIHTLSTRAVGVVLGLLTSVLIARALGPEGRGAYMYPLVLAAIAVAISHLSLEHANVHLASTRRADLRLLAGNSGLIAILTGSIAVLGMISALLAAPGAFAGVEPGWIVLLALSIPFGLHQLYMAGLAQLAYRLRALNMNQLIAGLAHLVAILILWLTGWLSAGGVLGVWVGIGILHWWLTCRSLQPVASLRPRLVPWLFRRSLAFGASIHLGMVLLFLHLRVDVIMLKHFSGLADVGLYTLAVFMAEALWLATDSVASASLPHQVETRGHGAAKLTARICRMNLALGGVVAGILALLALPAVRLLYGEAFLPAVSALWVLLPGVVAFGIQRPCGAHLLRLDRPFTISAVLAAAVLLNMILNMLWIPRWSIVGAALASTVSYTLSAATFLAWLLRAEGLSMRQALAWTAEDTKAVRRLLRPGAATAVPVIRPTSRSVEG